MQSPHFDDLRKLLNTIILAGYSVERDLSLPIQDHRNDNDAEHSWGLAIMACCLAPQVDPKLDVGKVCMLAVVHDVVEVFAGDTSVWAGQEALATKAARERQSLKKIKNEYTAFPWLGATIEEYEQRSSPEAQFVYALDKFISLLILYEDKGHYYHKGRITKQQFDQRFEPHRKKAHSHPAVGKYYDKLREAFDSHPEYFHQT